MKKYKIGYTAGVYDLFHIGHLNVIANAKQQCEYLIVGVSTDEVVMENKHKKPVIPFEERAAIVQALRYVDEVIAQERYDVAGKVQTAVEHHVEAMFVGSDWQGTEKWIKIEQELKKVGCEVVYLPHTDGISSSILRQRINK